MHLGEAVVGTADGASEVAPVELRIRAAERGVA